jgi:hypothetical protein
MSLSVGVFYHESAGTPWTMLPATSEWLTELGSLPALGDRLAVKGADNHLILPEMSPEQGYSGGNPPADFYKTVITITERIYNYSLCDIALVCEYKAF